MSSNPHHTTRIVFTGPESTGKSYLSSYVSSRLNAVLVEEYARQYLSDKEGEYTLADLKSIEQGQQKAESQALKSNPPLIIQDTDFLTIWIWYNYKYNLNPDRVYNYLQRHLPDHYCLCFPDIDWFDDPLRENPLDRHELFKLYESNINDLNVPYTVIQGSFEEREQLSLDLVESLDISSR